MKANQKRIAKERIKILFDLAKKEAGKNGLSRRYVQLARKIAMKQQIPLKDYKKKFCRKCSTYFTSKTLRTRIQKKDRRMTYTCLVCGNIQRYPYAREKLKKSFKKHT